MDLFSTTALLTVIESRDRPTAFIRDTFFPNGFQSDAEEIAFDKLKRRRNVAPFVSPLVPGKERAIRGRQTSTFTPAYVKPKNTIRPGEGFRRRPGEPLNGNMSAEDRYLQTVTDVLADQDDEVTRREEIMAAEALRTGKIIVSGEDYETQIVDYTAAGIRIFDEIMGGQGGEQFVSLIDQGRDRLTETIKEGEELGRVLSDDVVKAAADVDKAFADITNTVSTSLKAAIVSAALQLRYFLDLFNTVENRSLDTLTKQRDEKQRALNMKTGDYRGAFLPPKEQIEKELAEIDAQIKAHKDKQKLPNQPADNIPPPVTPYVLPSDTKAKGGGSRVAKITDAEREKKAIDELIKSLEEELKLVGLFDEARDKEIALRKAGANATDAQRDQITSLIEARYREQKAVEAVEEQLRRNADAALDLADISMNMIDSIIDGSFSAKDALAGLLRQMAQAMLMGQGPLANLFGMTPQSSGLGGLFGMMFGGPRAAGGSVTPGNLYRVNEKGEEFFSPGAHGRIIPHDEAGSGGAGFSFAPVYQIDARGADQAAVSRLEAGLAKTNREMESRIIATMRKAQKSNVRLR